MKAPTVEPTATPTATPVNSIYVDDRKVDIDESKSNKYACET